MVGVMPTKMPVAGECHFPSHMQLQEPHPCFNRHKVCMRVCDSGVELMQESPGYCFPLSSGTVRQAVGSCSFRGSKPLLILGVHF